MATARTATGPTDELAALVPRRSTGRTVAMVIGLLVVLVLVWSSPALLRPTLVAGSSYGGAAQTFSGSGQVLTVVDLDPRAWPFAELTGVGDVPGAQVAAAWVLAVEEGGLFPGADPARPPVDSLQEGYPDAAVEPGGNLPYRFSGGQALQLAVLWDVVDCTALAVTVPHAELSTAVGATISDALLEMVAPDPELLADSCRR